ncbi:hypothetical protein EYZ11_013116 [Aspergillus tanneri]|uniref:Uncharacterized protein n=1 Tax=Aspergillus tanneri TaxID=1220188 RepID=A0A4S3IYH8_9EURO|nr:hypothetical protein EYZ11_013116 [Aspergillus tanneri]
MTRYTASPQEEIEYDW